MILRMLWRSLVGIAACSTLASGQFLTRPAQRWETITTASFRIHYPADMRAWVLPIAQRMRVTPRQFTALWGAGPRRGPR
jgi:hypothetical protein